MAQDRFTDLNNNCKNVGYYFNRKLQFDLLCFRVRHGGSRVIRRRSDGGGVLCVRCLIAVTVRSWSGGIHRLGRNSGRGNSRGSAVVQVAVDCGRNVVVGGGGVVVFVVCDGRGNGSGRGGSSFSSSWIGCCGCAGRGGSAGN